MPARPGTLGIDSTTEAFQSLWHWAGGRALALGFRPHDGGRHRDCPLAAKAGELELDRHTAPQLGLVVQFLVRFSCMSQPLTADDLLPLIVKLSSAERRKLFLLIQKVGSDAEAYRAVPPAQDEFSSDENMLARDADGWEDVK